jgi:hypothetical protein
METISISRNTASFFRQTSVSSRNSVSLFREITFISLNTASFFRKTIAVFRSAVSFSLKIRCIIFNHLLVDAVLTNNPLLEIWNTITFSDLTWDRCLIDCPANSKFSGDQKRVVEPGKMFTI